MSYESKGTKIAHAPAGSRPKKQRDHPALYDTTFAPTAELESQRCVTASSLHPSITRPGGPRTVHCPEQLPNTSPRQISESRGKKEGGEGKRVSDCHRLHSVPVTERPCGRRLLVPDGAPSIGALPCGFKKNSEEEEEGPKGPETGVPDSPKTKNRNPKDTNPEKKKTSQPADSRLGLQACAQSFFGTEATSVSLGESASTGQRFRDGWIPLEKAIDEIRYAKLELRPKSGERQRKDADGNAARRLGSHLWRKTWRGKK